MHTLAHTRRKTSRVKDLVIVSIGQPQHGFPHVVSCFSEHVLNRVRCPLILVIIIPIIDITIIIIAITRVHMSYSLNSLERVYRGVHSVLMKGLIKGLEFILGL